jgi:hypothetical protein
MQKKWTIKKFELMIPVLQRSEVRALLRPLRAVYVIVGLKPNREKHYCVSYSFAKLMGIYYTFSIVEIALDVNIFFKPITQEY